MISGGSLRPGWRLRLPRRRQPSAAAEPFYRHHEAQRGLFVIPGTTARSPAGMSETRDERRRDSGGRQVPTESQSLPASAVGDLTADQIRSEHHNHGDHTGGHPEFIKTAQIIAHRNARRTWSGGSRAPQIGLRTRRRCFWVARKSRRITSGAATPTATPSSIFVISERCTPAIWSWGKRADGTLLSAVD